MVSLVDFYFHFPANFQTKTSPHMFSIFSHVAHAVSLGYLWFSRRSNPPEVAEFCTDHIDSPQAIFVTLASIFSETVGGMKLKFGEEIEKKLIYQDPSPFR